MQEYLTIEDHIQAYIDKELNEAERLLIEQKITNDTNWRDHYQAVLALHEILSTGLEPMQPSMRFTKNVMENIAGLEIAKPIKHRQNPWIFRIVGGTLGFLLLVILAYSYSTIEFSSGALDTNFPIPALQVPEVNWATYLGRHTTLFLFLICTILGFYLAEKLLIKKSWKQQ